MSSDADKPPLDPDIADAVEGHARFRAAFERDRHFYRHLATRKQRPRILWIGCSDSRVVPAQITAADPGELFEVRNIANTVPPAHADDDSVGAAIAYAIGPLGVDDIVVCGHTGCGGVAALLDSPDDEMPAHLTRWLDFTRPAHRLIAAARVAAGERLLETVKAHVQFQLDNLMTYPDVARRVGDNTLDIHGWLYDMEQGDLLAYDRDLGEWRRLLETASA